jgi:hypothetical protein
METATLRKKLPTKEERAKVGKAADAIYAPLREQLEKEHWGEYISINELIAHGKIIWFGEERDVRVIFSDGEEPAIGTRLLKDCVVTMNFRNDTLIIEEPMP